MNKMVILRGNSAGAGSYPDEKGNTIDWPKGALHVAAAEQYATRKGYTPVVLDIPGQPQSQTSPQAEAAVKLFLGDPLVTGFYGFSGGGYNVRHILERLATKNPEDMWRIDYVVVLGAPLQTRPAYEAAKYNKLLPKEVARASWTLVYMTNPPMNHPVVPKNVKDSHMFCPEWLLAEDAAANP